MSGRTRFGRTLVVVQVAISIVLLVGAGLFLGTVRNLRHVDVGFDAHRLLLVEVNPLLNGYKQARVVSLYGQLLDELGHVPGVQAVTLSAPGLLSGSVSSTGLFVQGQPPPAPRAENASGPGPNAINRVVVAPGFFQTMRIPVVAGRRFTSRDRAGAPDVILINEAAARRFFPHGSPIGQHVGNTYETRGDQEIVGVVADVKYDSVRDPAPPTLYVPYQQDMVRPHHGGPATFEVRTSGDPLAVVPAVRAAIRHADPTLPIYRLSTQQEQIEERFADERLFAQAYAIFGALALAIASIGLFGLMSYNVARRTNEIGIRMALGAERGTVTRMVMGESLRLVLVGIAAGVVVVLAAGRLVAAMLFGIAPTDVATIAGAVVVMMLVSGLAGYLPARRASRIDPIAALRYE